MGQIFKELGLPVSKQEPAALNFLSQIIHSQANAFGFQDGFLVLALVFILAMIPAYMLGNTMTAK